MQINMQSNLDIALIVNRYKNSIKATLQSLLLQTGNFILINFNDSLFNFLNKLCISSIEYMDNIKNINGNDSIQETLKLLYLNNVKLYLSSESTNSSQMNNIINIIKENQDKIACIEILQEYYGPFTKHTFIEKNTTDNFTLSVNLLQDNNNLTIELLHLSKIPNDSKNANSIIVNNIDWRYLFINLSQLENIMNNFNLLINSNIKRLVVVFDYILNNSAFINLDFFTNFESNSGHLSRILDLCFDINTLANNNNPNYNSYNYPKEEFNKRLQSFIVRVTENTKHNDNLIKNFMVSEANKPMYTDDGRTNRPKLTNMNINAYYESLRDVDLDNKSVIYNYANSKNKQTKYNDELYKTIKFKGATSHEDYCKPYNNFIRDIAYKFSIVHNKQLLYNLDPIVVYFIIPQTKYVKDMLYVKSGMILTLVTNVVATYTLPDVNLSDHIIKVYLQWNNIFLILHDYGSNGVILPYGTQLQIESMIPLAKTLSTSQNIVSGNYAISATPINTLSLLPSLNINTFIQSSR